MQRAKENPILSPTGKAWENMATFNGCPVKLDGKIVLLYRAMSAPTVHHGVELSLSTIGYAESQDGINFVNRRQVIKPEYDWELFGCEDPRVTKLGDNFYIFYTALSTYPFSPQGIKIAVAKTKDFKNFEKHQVTHFNSKAMALFPEKIKGKICALLTVHTDMPPAKIAIAWFDNEEQIWSKDYWQDWYASLHKHDIHLLRSRIDHLELGAPPLKTAAGWLVIYSYIKNYLTEKKEFTIEAVLLDLNDPKKVIARSKNPLLTPQAEYELHGNVENIVFPAGALLTRGKLYLYYGAADTTCCLATQELSSLLENLEKEEGAVQQFYFRDRTDSWKLSRFAGNPVITPIPEHPWESMATFNPAVFYDGRKVHLVYRAMSSDYTSVLGYAASSDGLSIAERLSQPIYQPRKDFEKKAQPGNSGCEDPRITKIGDTLYMCYTAFNAKDTPRVALSTILVENFVKKNWQWEEPVVMSLPGMADKNSCVLQEKIRDRYVIFHRMHHDIWIDCLEHLDFSGDRWLMGTDWLKKRPHSWDSEKIGIGGPPLKTNDGWLLIYHGLSQEDKKYRLGAMLLEGEDPTKVIARLDEPILEPDAEYENKGIRPGTVFACGNCILGEDIFVYYGGADKVVCVATVKLARLLEKLKKNINS